MKYYSASGQSQPPQDPASPGNIYSLNTEFFSVDVDPLDLQTYHAEAEVVGFGSLTLARINSTGAVVSRKNEEFKNLDLKRFSFILVLTGEVIISHHLGMSELKAGHFMLIDNSFARSMFVSAQVSILQITMPRVVLARYLNEPQEYEAVVLSANLQQEQQEPSSESFLFGVILSSWEKIKAGVLREFAPVISDSLLRRIAEAYTGHQHQHSSRKTRRITQAKELIEEQLCNPELSVESIASGMRVSSRYLRSLFSRSEKISHYILRRRLEECARLLSEPQHQELSITAVAFRCGFNSMAHFSRTFKKTYSMTPRDYRRHHLHLVRHHA
ncbi:MAG: helix-turn-helix domain-containing protein [Pseudomonadales bacterium]|jgi:AraC-like DNA-binding protein|nr:helix-turn-helix domain-containing protein [Pseudomonadales bacterium]